MRTRRKRVRPKPPIPLCPEHGVPLLVGRVVRRVQYRYCPVEGCRQSARTWRILPGRPRKPKGNQKTTEEPQSEG